MESSRQTRSGRVTYARHREPSQYTPFVPCVGQTHTPVTGGGNCGATVSTMTGQIDMVATVGSTIGGSVEVSSSPSGPWMLNASRWVHTPLGYCPRPELAHSVATSRT